MRGRVREIILEVLYNSQGVISKLNAYLFTNVKVNEYANLKK